MNTRDDDNDRQRERGEGEGEEHFHRKLTKNRTLARAMLSWFSYGFKTSRNRVNGKCSERGFLNEKRRLRKPDKNDERKDRGHKKI